MERGLWLGSGPALPATPSTKSSKGWATAVRRWASPLCEPWEKPRGTILAFGALGCMEPALRVGGSRRPGRRRGEGPALKLGAQFWGLLRPQLDSQDSRSELHARGTEPWAGGPIMSSPAPLRLRGLDGVSIEGGRRVAASRSLAVQTWG